MAIPRASAWRAAAAAAPASWDRGVLSVAFVDNAAIRELSRNYLKNDLATDVLAFPLDEGQTGEPDAEPRMVGEVIVSAERALQEAETRGLAAEAELTLYLVHGILHLAGFDDHCTRDRARMYAREQEIMCGLGYSYVR